MAQPNFRQSVNQAFNVGGSHSRSLSQPVFFTNNCLPPLSPIPPTESSLASSNSSMKDVTTEEADVSSQGSPATLSFSRENFVRGRDSLPPRKGHHRSNSDVALEFSPIFQSPTQLVPISSQGSFGRKASAKENLGNDKPNGLNNRAMDMVSHGKFGNEAMCEGKSEAVTVDDLFHSFINLDQVDAFHSSGFNSFGVENKDKSSVVSDMKMSVSATGNTELETISRLKTNYRERFKRSAAGDISPPPRHCRSLSMDSAIGNFQFGDESPNLQSSLSNRVDQLSPSNSVSDNSDKFNLDFGHGEFNEIELKRIISDDRLAEVAISDPKRVKRILANRQSAARSKERKLRYISELEHKVQTLQTEATTLSAQFTILQKDYSELTNQNNELKFRLQAMKQQALIRDELHEALTAEVQRLKLSKMELKEDGRTSNGTSHQGPMKIQMWQQPQPPQNQQLNQTQMIPPTTCTSMMTSSAPAST